MPISLRILFYFVPLVFSFGGKAVTVDWSGWSRGETYYQGDVQFHGTFYFALKPTVQVIDGLTVSARLDAVHRQKADELFKKSSWLNSDPEPQGGLFLLHSEKSFKTDWSLFQHNISLSQFYITWQGEFARFQLGKAPYHFGMGLTYSADTPSLSNWVSHVTWLSLYLKYNRFYFHPAVVVREENRLAPLLAGGISGESWKVEGLYRHEKFHRVELFGQYEKDFWDTKLSVSYGVSKAHLAAALEAGVNLWFLLKPRVELKAGYASKNFSFHPNYNVGLFLWNYLITAPSCFKGTESSTEEEDNSLSPLWVEEGCINNVVYFAPRLVFSFWEETVKVAPQFVAGFQISEKRFDYEMNLEVKYSLESFLTFRVQGGLFYEKKKTNFGFLTQAAVEF
ncbi:MAG: hypothetical protein OXB86_00745 [Bdellovibrionales bacterium]|nr:hypothetical protein [Bdellovibrionales bacterium]